MQFKTVICPKCKHESNYLLHVEIVKQYWKAMPSSEDKGDMLYDEVLDEETEETRGYICSNCNDTLAIEKEDAYDLFKIKKVRRG